ncbi:uncharacterized protein MELLADRAFT_66033 [Melampsora larici-populina 98AG31]|uniref:DUF6589 domain-containing protein n=1 Tax=Melampsora larici-populina (strain 98AG31 / pathotype 3-4-7) TaxID=747676 RepID=F4RXM8_MELLP|nr:uncharacterized protein MELLADRAFT_66033 [Melampsora larici-populina 98AG31]EGG02752.1 hypothetical protein MELLADRAFT_66033 [Melampsora larici-populina 98AG31]
MPQQHQQHSQPTPPMSLTLSHTLEILAHMSKLDFSPRDFMYTFFSSNHAECIYRCRLMKNGSGEKQNKSILKNYGNLIKSSEVGLQFWETFILNEASAIVNGQDVVRGAYPKGAYVSSNQIPSDFFSESSEARRTEKIKDGMPFLHSLISQKISMSLKHKASKPDSPFVKPNDNSSRRTSINPKTPKTPESAVTRRNSLNPTEPSVKGDEEDEVLSLANLVYVKSTPSEVADHKAQEVPVAICAMIAYQCNRRCNAVPLQNGLMVLAGGVSCRVNEYLQCFGLTTQVFHAVLDAMEHLRISQEAQLMEVFKVNQKLLPLLCFDNVDIHLRIHNSRIDLSSRLFHGTWGFYTVFRAALLASCDAEALSLAVFVEAMKNSDQKPVMIDSFAPRAGESVHFEAVIKAQLALALVEHVKHLPKGPSPQDLPPLAVAPPKIDPIEFHTPNIHFLRMMDAPDSSADGVSQVLDQVMTQIGMQKEQYAENLLVAGGDVGSNQLVKSLRGKLHPPIDSIEGLSWVLSVFGPAHTTWNFAEAVWALHWGNSNDGEDRGAWRSSFELGGDYSKPVVQQDFNSIMRSIQIVHKANLVFIIR